MGDNLRLMREEDLGYVLEWRNNIEVRKNSYTQHEITKEEHEKWFKSVSRDRTKRQFIFEVKGQPLGVIGFFNIDYKNKSAFWSFYSGNLSIKGIGAKMEIMALRFAFEDLQLEKLNGEVFKSNLKVVNHHLKYGFIIEGVFKKHIFLNGNFEDIYRIAIFKRDYLILKNENFNKDSCFKPGKIFEKKFKINSEDIKKFADLSGDINKLNFESDFAGERGVKERIPYGIIPLSYIYSIIRKDFPGNGTICLNNNIEFLGPVYFDRMLKINLKIIRKIGKKLQIEIMLIDDEAGDLLINGESEVLLL